MSFQTFRFAAFLAAAAAAPASADEQLAFTNAAVAPPPSAADTARPAPRSRPIQVLERPFVRFGPLSLAGATYYPYRFEGHVHTSHSPDAKHPTVDILAAAEQLGLDALVITDHGVSRAQFDFPRYGGKLVPFVGREIGGEYGHAVMWNVTEDTMHNPSRTTLEERSRFAHERGGLLVFAHPGWWIDGRTHNPLDWMTPEALRRGGIAGDVDAIELWNGVYYGPLPKLVNAWVELLAAGVFVPIVGNSDFHSFPSHKLGNAHNIAYCDKPEIATCLWPAVREGRVVVTDGPAAALSVNDKLPGSIVDPAGSPLRISVSAQAPEGGTLRVYVGEEVVHTLALERDVRREAQWEVPSPTADSWVRIDIQRKEPRRNRPSVSLLSNPVLIDVGEQRTWR